MLEGQEVSTGLSATLVKTLDVSNTLAEGIQWHIASQSVWWTDIERKRVYQYTPYSDSLIMHPLPHRVGCFAFCHDSNDMLIAFEHGIATFNLATKQCNWHMTLPSSLPKQRFNDGRVDPSGRLWAGTMVEASESNNNSGFLMRLDNNGNSKKILYNIQISNGLCWNVTGTNMFHTDSPERLIYCYNFDVETGTVSNKQPFYSLKCDGFPDGACVDKHNFIWVAVYGSGKVIRISPEGELVSTLTIPAQNVTCVAIGGENFDLLFVTTAKDSTNKPPPNGVSLGGSIFIYQLSESIGNPEQHAKPITTL